MSLFELIATNQQQGYDGFTNHDVAVLADWANGQKQGVQHPEWRRAYALIREGADLLLRRRARSTTEIIASGKQIDYPELRSAIDDFNSTFYGPHDCPHCGLEVVRRAMEQGGEYFEHHIDTAPAWCLHRCDPNKISQRPRPSVNASIPPFEPPNNIALQTAGTIPR